MEQHESEGGRERVCVCLRRSHKKQNNTHHFLNHTVIVEVKGDRKTDDHAGNMMKKGDHEERNGHLVKGGHLYRLDAQRLPQQGKSNTDDIENVQPSHLTQHPMSK